MRSETWNGKPLTGHIHKE